MNDQAQAIIQSTFEASNQGHIGFGDVIGNLMRAGVESYQVDYRSGRTTYHLSDDSTLALSCEPPHERIADAFNADAMRAAILGAQQGRVMYPEFKLLSQRAGCVGYTVWLAGRHVSYFGRKGEVHVERFPG